MIQSDSERKLMRRKDKEITDIDEIESIIKKAARCCIGLVDDGEPYLVPVCFGYERKSLYFHSAPEGRKVDIIKRNNRVCFEIDTDLQVMKSEKSCDWSMKYRSVVGTGKAHILESDEDKAHGLNMIMRQYTEKDLDLPQPVPESVLVARIDIESITGKKSGY